MEYLRRFYDKFRLYLTITGISGIARRYFVKNGIDGSLTMLGIIVGSWGGGVTQSKVIILAGLGGVKRSKASQSARGCPVTEPLMPSSVVSQTQPQASV